MAIIQLLEIGPGSALFTPKDKEMLEGAIFCTTEGSTLSGSGFQDLQCLKLPDPTSRIWLDKYSFFDVKYKILFK